MLLKHFLVFMLPILCFEKVIVSSETRTGEVTWRNIMKTMKPDQKSHLKLSLKDLRRNFKNCRLKYTNSTVQHAGLSNFREVNLNCSDLESHRGGIKLVQCLKKRGRGNFLCTDVKPFIYQITLVNQSNYSTPMPLPITCHCWKVKKIKKRKHLTIDQI